jgi:hypothetical protein
VTGELPVGCLFRPGEEMALGESAIEERKLALVAARALEAGRGKAQQPHRTRSGVGPREQVLRERE